MKKQSLIEAGIVIGTLVLTVFLSLSHPGRLIDLKLYDLYSMAKPRPKEWNKILYVNIDDQSIDLVGRWPWPRSVIAQGLDVMKQFGADKVLFDIEFIEQSRDSLNYDFYESFLDGGNQNLSFSRLKDDLILHPDKILLRSMMQGDGSVYLACRGVDETKKTRTDLDQDDFKELSRIYEKFFIPLPDPKITNMLPVDPFMEFPAFPLYLGARGLGFTTADKDIDGAVRKICLFRVHNDYLVPQLAMPMILDELGVGRDGVSIRTDGKILLKTGDGQTVSIPVTKRGEMFVNWTRPWKDHPFSEKGDYIPFSALIEYVNYKKILAESTGLLKMPGLSADDRAAITENIMTVRENLKILTERLSVLKGKIVITGNTSSSSTDIGAITIDPQAPLALLQANVINTIYQRAFLTQVPLSWNVLFAFAIILTVFLVSINVKSAMREVLISAVMIPAVLLALYALLAVFGWIVNYFMIIAGTLIALVAFTAYKFVLFDKQKNFIKKAFMQYLSPDVVQELIAKPELLKLGGERREITAFFSDVQGFTTISEKLTPEEVVKLLNMYLTAMTNLILENGGTVDKYEGDAIVAFFGAPIPHPDHAARCCAAAVAMQNALVTLRKKWVEMGYPEVIARIGINTGPAIIGNMGSEQRMDYTMMGDTVNTAARFEGANKPYGTHTMISESTYAQVKDGFVARKLDMLRVVGKSQPVSVYELVGRIGEVPEEKLSVIHRFHEGQEDYLRRNWTRAADIFRELDQKHQDAPSRLYLGRCEELLKKPPDEGWTGVYALTSK